MSITQWAHNIELNESGIWCSPDFEPVSYPEAGHAACLQIENQSVWFQHRNECIASLIRRFPPTGDILDIGGGNGFVTQRLIAEGFVCTLLEPGISGAMNAKILRNIPDVICATLQSAKFECGKIPAIGIFDVIEHIKDDRAYIEDIHKVLMPNGMLYLTVPAHQSLWSKHDEVAGHFRRYSNQQLDNLLEGKFEIIFTSALFAALVFPMYFLKALPHKLFDSDGMLSRKQEHGVEGGLSRSMVKWLLRNEAGRIALGKRAKIGTSYAVVARKIAN